MLKSCVNPTTQWARWRAGGSNKSDDSGPVGHNAREAYYSSGCILRPLEAPVAGHSAAHHRDGGWGIDGVKGARLVQAEESVNINRPAEVVFAFLARPENHPRFVPGVLEFRLTSGTMAEGAEAVGTRRVFGIVRRLPYRITAFQPNRDLAVSTAIGPLEGGATYYVEREDDAAAHVRFVVAGGFRGPLRFADRILAGMLTRDAGAVCRNLKTVLENETALEG